MAARRSESNELRIERVYDAPVKAVWDAWTDPVQAAKWWGPRGFTITTHSKDLRPGGTWRYTMHGPDGVDYPNVTLYHEVETCAKLVYDHGGSDDRPPMFRVTVTFAEVEGKTRMHMTMTLPTPQAAAETRAFVKKAGGNATWDRLDEYLAKTRAGEERFVINRSFDAPIAQMFDMWTQPTHFLRWLPPTGFTMEFIEADVRPGGSAFYVMRGDAGASMYGRIQYLQFERPTLVVYSQQFCNERGEVSRHPMVPTWPETMLTTVTLAAEADDQTRVTVTWRPHGSVTAAEMAEFVKMRGSMTQGWTGSFDKLEAALETLA